MTKDEILEKLESKGIITIIAGEYILTEKYLELLAPSSIQLTPIDMTKYQKGVDNYDELLNTKTNGSDWPLEILETTGRTRAAAFLDACEVPFSSPCGEYRLRGLNLEAVNVIGNLVASKDIAGATFIEAVQLYYKHTLKPKGFKNFMIDGDALDVYNEHIKGTLKSGLQGSGPAENPNEWR